MKRKNGFTLVELIATLVLMIALGVLITSNVVGMLGHQNDEDYKNFKAKIESSACAYAINHEIPADGVDIKTLVEAGLVSEDEKDPSTNKVVKQSIKIKVEMKDGVRTCTYPDEE